VRLASVLVMLALVIELGSLFWSHPLSFLTFAIVGGAALGAGLLIYLYWLYGLVSGRPDDGPAHSRIKE
jgi:O-antigen/teichoic acid export membrane protein